MVSPRHVIAGPSWYDLGQGTGNDPWLGPYEGRLKALDKDV